MTTAPLLSYPLAVRAAEENLGEFVGPLTPRHGASLRTAVVGAVVLAGAGWAWQSQSWISGWAEAGLLVIALAGLVSLAVGLIELAPTPGRVYLFENGFLHVQGPDVDAVSYDTTRDGEWMRIKSRTLLNQRVA